MAEKVIPPKIVVSFRANGVEVHSASLPKPILENIDYFSSMLDGDNLAFEPFIDRPYLRKEIAKSYCDHLLGVPEPSVGYHPLVGLLAHYLADFSFCNKINIKTPIHISFVHRGIQTIDQTSFWDRASTHEVFVDIVIKDNGWGWNLELHQSDGIAALCRETDPNKFKDLEEEYKVKWVGIPWECEYCRSMGRKCQLHNKNESTDRYADRAAHFCPCDVCLRWSVEDEYRCDPFSSAYQHLRGMLPNCARYRRHLFKCNGRSFEREKSVTVDPSHCASSTDLYRLIYEEMKEAKIPVTGISHNCIYFDVEKYKARFNNFVLRSVCLLIKKEGDCSSPVNIQETSDHFVVTIAATHRRQYNLNFLESEDLVHLDYNPRFEGICGQYLAKLVEAKSKVSKHQTFATWTKTKRQLALHLWSTQRDQVIDAFGLFKNLKNSTLDEAIARVSNKK